VMWWLAFGAALVVGGLAAVFWVGRRSCRCGKPIRSGSRFRLGWRWPVRRQAWDTPTEEHPVVPGQREAAE
jgi:hypothetical protein